VLAEAPAKQLGDALVLGAEVESILSLENRVEIGVRNGQGQSGTLVADKLILATPAAISARLIAPFDREAAAALAKIEYAPVAVGFHGYKKSDIRNPLDGFGFLIPEKENRKILGTIRSSTIFPGRAPEGYAALTTFVGGARQPELAQLPEAEIYQIIEDELRELLGVTGGPVIRKIKIWPKAIPQYGRRHAEILTRIAAFESAHPAIRVAGNFRKGVSVADCVDYAYETAEKIIEENHAGRQDERDQPEDTEARETAAALAAI
jgi:oxygen-dependent protoporphyrinogen oxidase